MAGQGQGQSRSRAGAGPWRGAGGAAAHTGGARGKGARLRWQRSPGTELLTWDGSKVWGAGIDRRIALPLPLPAAQGSRCVLSSALLLLSLACPCWEPPKMRTKPLQEQASAPGGHRGTLPAASSDREFSFWTINAQFYLKMTSQSIFLMPKLSPENWVLGSALTTLEQFVILNRTTHFALKTMIVNCMFLECFHLGIPMFLAQELELAAELCMPFPSYSHSSSLTLGELSQPHRENWRPGNTGDRKAHDWKKRNQFTCRNAVLKCNQKCYNNKICQNTFPNQCSLKSPFAKGRC